MAYCYKCGAVLPQGAKFCQKCGTRMPNAGSTGSASSAAERQAAPSPAPRDRQEPIRQNPVPSAGANPAAAVSNVIEWIDTSVKASDSPGEFVAAGWSEGRAIDPRTILNAAAKVVTAAQQTLSAQTAPSAQGVPAQGTGRLTPTSPAGNPRVTPNSSVPPQTAANPNTASPAAFCRYCGKPLIQGRRFCGYCGKQIG